MRWGKLINVIVFLIIVSVFTVTLILPRFTKYHLPVLVNQSPEIVNHQHQKIKNKAHQLKKFAANHNYSNKYSFIIDMSQHSGYKRFYVFDNALDTIVNSGLVAHGSCNKTYLQDATFNNKVGCGCSANGKYKIDYMYDGRFGKAFKLIGLDSSNNNAFERNIVLHAYDCVPNTETYPQPICNSLGCPMVSYNFLETLKMYIRQSPKPIVLWILDDAP